MTLTLDPPPAAHFSLFTFPGFSGTLLELAATLRAGRLLPGEVPLLRLTRELLGRITAQRLSPDEHAEALPVLASVIALKVRLLLPQPDTAPTTDFDDDSGLDGVLESVEALAELGELVSFLAQRRLERAGLIAARPLEIEWPRRVRPAVGRSGLEKLVKAAQSTVREVQVPLLSRERLTLAGALRALRAFGARLRTFTFLSVPVADWGERATYFSALLEGVKEGSFSAEQAEVFGDIEVRQLGEEV
ncbi:ScpA family protein [Deinococcus rubellus]|uniref:Segregation/condensation protein A n=1 Tax=Deinococcus rubellus TaxID=1889240 RepID=A0ABY5YLH6_9DEIO|nr:segregation/condensation protein A [Deinococcus rubellus]UWX64986.1 segregation/condensation protein A [Deinococcus rubellus]